MNNQPLKPNDIETKNYRKAKMPKKKKIAIISSAAAGVICIGAAGFWFLHPHSYSEWQTVTAPTCTEKGEGIFRCFCGETEVRALDPDIINGHTKIIDKGYAATKTEDGLTDGSHCGVCNETIKSQEVIYAIGSQGLAYNATSGTTCKITGIGTCTDTEVVIPRYIDGYKVTSIGASAFYGCSSLTSITIPEGVTSIGVSAFDGCSSLTSITIPEGVTSIGEWAFYGCSGLTSITYTGSLSEWNDIAKGTYWDNITADYIVYCADSNVTKDGMVKYFSQGLAYNVTFGTTCEITGIGICTDTEVVIPRYIDGYEVTSIGNRAFSGCIGLTSITIPEGVTSIVDYAFYACIGLTSITIPESVTSIGNSAFLGCSNLTSITYTGSLSEWNDIAKGTSWDSYTADYIVYCADGSIAKDGTVKYN